MGIKIIVGVWILTGVVIGFIIAVILDALSVDEWQLFDEKQKEYEDSVKRKAKK